MAGAACCLPTCCVVRHLIVERDGPTVTACLMRTVGRPLGLHIRVLNAPQPPLVGGCCESRGHSTLPGPVTGNH